MKRFSTLTVVLLSVFALSYSLANAGQVGENKDVILHYEIIFDGFCDGVTLDIDTNTGLATGIYDSPCATCSFPDRMAGTTGNPVGPVGILTNLSWETGPTFIFTRLLANGRWEHYDYSGVIFNSGTFSSCTAGAVAHEDAVPSTAVAGYDY